MGLGIDLHAYIFLLHFSIQIIYFFCIKQIQMYIQSKRRQYLKNTLHMSGKMYDYIQQMHDKLPLSSTVAKLMFYLFIWLLGPLTQWGWAESRQMEKATQRVQKANLLETDGLKKVSIECDTRDG